MNHVMDSFNQLVEIIHKLRAPGGCPWDAEQTHQSMKALLLEETYEVIEAIESDNTKSLKEELGDLLLHVLFHSEIARESGSFSLEDVVAELKSKLIRRHPHVFGEGDVRDTKEVLHQWSKIKAKEGKKSVLDGVPKRLPSLQLAQRLSERAARTGFDWKSVDQIWSKLDEELKELRAALESDNKKNVEEETGDVLTVIVNLARKIGIDAESSLRLASQRFRDRFNFIEEALSKSGKDIHNSTLEEMERLWNKAKIALSN